MRLADRLGGHLVQGHVDAVGTRRRAATALPDGSMPLAIAAPREVLRYVVREGLDHGRRRSASPSPRLADDGFDIAVIPHTLAVTTLGAARAGDR